MKEIEQLLILPKVRTCIAMIGAYLSWNIFILTNFNDLISQFLPQERFWWIILTRCLKIYKTLHEPTLKKIFFFFFFFCQRYSRSHFLITIKKKQMVTVPNHTYIINFCIIGTHNFCGHFPSKLFPCTEQAVVVAINQYLF